MATPTYTPISPDLNTFGGTVPKYDGKDTTLFASTSFLWTICFMFIIMAAVYQYIMVGIYRLEPSEQGARKSKEVFKKTTLGLLGVLGLFLLLAALNKTFLTGDVGAPPLQTNSTSSIPTGTAPVTKNEQAPQSANKTAPTGNAGLGKLRPNEPNTSYEARVASHNTILARLTSVGIHTNHNDAPCTEAQFKELKPSCTSLAYLKEETVLLLIKIKSLCACTLVVTGGTEPGHITHKEGARAVDLRIGGPRGDPNNQDQLYVFVRNISGVRLGSDKNCFEKYTYASFTFCDEKPPNAQHFHVN